QLERRSWRELWPLLLAAAEPQHPWLIGDDRRRVFGLTRGRSPGDVRVEPRAQTNDYQVFAGSLLDVTEGAEIAVYDAEPRRAAAGRQRRRAGGAGRDLAGRVGQSCGVDRQRHVELRVAE